MKLKYLMTLLAVAVIGSGADAKIDVITSTSDLAYFAEQIGGELVEVEAIAPPNADIHFIEVRPSYMVKVARADVALKVGMELDLWMDRIIDGSRNSDLEKVDCSKYIEPLEVPSFEPDARHGDLHRYGNPHYWLHPDNVAPITRAIVEGLAAADPEHADVYRANRKAYLDRLNAAIIELKQAAEPLNGSKVIYYHNSWPYFNEFTGVEAAGFVEPYPGVPPSPSHVKDLTDRIKGQGIKVIAIEPYFDHRVPEKVASGSGATVVTIYPSIREKDKSYVDWYRRNIEILLEAVK